ncbi:porin [Acidisoma silvae]|uniref:Porin n=1 Tax=Acidisoma silvae TaxID=2802396 RepID=A0A963YV33_9PROT|nr:porin [Acidisoma silvae]MCB8877391.1 porin [Acidisoma silvae]
MRQFVLVSAATLTAAVGLAAIAKAQVTTPDFTQTISPGSVVARLDGRVSQWYGVSGFTGQSYGGTKYSGSGLAGYMRLFPGFDGVAANGLQYGAQAEIRENTETSASAGASTETLYVLRDFGYLGLPQLGLVRFGQQEGALYLNDAGRFESGNEAFDDGGWNGDVENFFVNSAQRPIYPWTWSNSTRTADKIDYITPTWNGLNFSASFEPNQTGENYSPAVTSTTTSTDMRRNTFEIGTTYKTKLDGFGIIVDGGYMNAGAVAYNSTANGQSYQGLSVGSLGATVTYGGITVGGNTKFGNMNGQFEPNYKGGANAIAWLTGGVYTIGALSAGGSYFVYDSQGDYSTPTTEGTRREMGAAAGATYVLAPGVKLFASYLYGTRHQDGYDFLSGTAGSANNNTMAQVLALGTWLYW